MDYVIGGIEIAVLIIGIVEAAKAFGVSGLGSQALALVLGFLFVGLAAAIGEGLVPAQYVVWIELVVKSLAGALAAMGYYDLAKRVRILPIE